MGSIGDCFDNSLAESFFGTLQLELLDRRHWETRDQLASAIFDYVRPSTTRAAGTPRSRTSVPPSSSPATSMSSVLDRIPARDWLADDANPGGSKA
jgi:transposase InsO family protein